MRKKVTKILVTLGTIFSIGMIENHVSEFPSNLIASNNLSVLYADEANFQLSGQIKNVNQVNGTFDVQIYAQHNNGIKEIKVPIWSAKDQNDLKWYDAQRQSDGSYIVHMNISNHKYNRGMYTTHVYMYGNDGSVHAISLGQTEIPAIPAQLTGTITNVNKDSGSYDVVINATHGSGVREVRVPIWSKANQSDIKWYQATKQADGSYIVHMNINNHNYNRGMYTTHVYMYGNDGSVHAISLGQTEIPAIATQLTGKITNVNKDSGSYDVVINATHGTGVREVRV
ncbi:MAG TPA: GBS Bsp-like repeat-containing protein, partial [Enterococcus columbae]|nr:GBS Bsp-like repeat-containing protein [Enterococcus columbae]